MKIISRKDAIEKGLKYYFTGKKCQRGHLSKRRTDSGQCYECAKERRKIVYHEEKSKRGESITFTDYCSICQSETEHYASNGNCKVCANKRSSSHYFKDHEENKVKRRMNHLENKDERNKKAKEYYRKNTDKWSAYGRKYREENAEKIKARTKTEKAMADHRNRQRKRLSTKQGKIEQFLRNSIHRILSSKNGAASFSFVDYTKYDLIQRIESTFKDGMSWENYGKWHIDHIIPVKAFIDNNCTDPEIVNALSNLRALWASENIAKSDKYFGDIEKDIERLKNAA